MLDDDRLKRIEELLVTLVGKVETKPHYSVEELALKAGRSSAQVRQWANLGRIYAEKSNSQCGTCRVWVIRHSEYERYCRDGLLPIDPHRNNPDREGCGMLRNPKFKGPRKPRGNPAVL